MQTVMFCQQQIKVQQWLPFRAYQIEHWIVQLNEQELAKLCPFWSHSWRSLGFECSVWHIDGIVCVWDHIVNPGNPLAGSLRIATVFQGRKAPDAWPQHGGWTLHCLWELNRGLLLFLSRPGPICVLSDGNLNSGQNKRFSHWIPHPWPCLVQGGPAVWMALLHVGQV